MHYPFICSLDTYSFQHIFTGCLSGPNIFGCLPMISIADRKREMVRTTEIVVPFLKLTTDKKEH